MQIDIATTVTSLAPLERIPATAYDLCAAVADQITVHHDRYDQRALRHSVVWWLVTLHDGPDVPSSSTWKAWLERAGALLGMPSDGDDFVDCVALLFAYIPPGTPGTPEYATQGATRLRMFMATNEAALRSTSLRDRPAPAPYAQQR